MPESVDTPAPVSTTSRPRRRSSGTTTPRRSLGASTVTGSARVAGLRAGPALVGLHLAVLGRRGGHQVVEEVLGRVGDLVHRTVEDLLVDRGRARGATDLAHELECGVLHLLRGRGWLEVVQRADV